MNDKQPQLPAAFECPGEPDWKVIDIIHRQHDGVITLHRGSSPGRQFENLCAIPANRLPGLFEQLIEDLAEDGLFSINAYATPRRPGDGRYIDDNGEPLPYARRNKGWLRYLTACYVDIDCYKLGIPQGRVIGEVLVQADEGTIPPPSLILRSGHGIWLFWLLAKPDGSLYGGFSDQLARYTRIQSAIQGKFARTGGDAAARDAVRVTRVPGSLNTKTPQNPKRVDYLPLVNGATGRVNTYTFEDLAEAFGVNLTGSPRGAFLPDSRPKDPARIERGRKGQAGRWRSAYEQFSRLWQLRGTWPVGTRNGAAFVLAAILKRAADISEADILEQFNQLFADLEPGGEGEQFTREEFDQVIAEAFSSQAKPLAKMSDQYIADRLRVTPDEAEVLRRFAGERGERWRGWPSAAEFTTATATDQPPLSLSEVRRRRRGLLQSTAANWKTLPSLESLCDFIESAGLIRPSPATISRDLKQLGIENPRKWSGRKGSSLDQPQLFDPPESTPE